MRPSPITLLTASDTTVGDSIHVLSGTGAYCVLLADISGSLQPVALRHDNASGRSTYLVTAHPNPGHSVNLAERLNARFGLTPHVTSQWFVSFQMKPDKETPASLSRQQSYVPKTRRFTRWKHT